MTTAVVERRFRLASPTTATIIGVLVLLAAVASLVADGFSHQLTFTNNGTTLIICGIYAVAGVVVARRQPRNPVGWFLLMGMFLFILTGEAGSYMELRYRLGYSHLPLGPVAVVLQSLWVPGIALFPLVFLFFPDGRLPSRRWRWVFWAYIALIVFVTTVGLAQAISAIVHHDIHVNSSGSLITPGHKTSPAAAVAFPVIASIALMWVSFIVQKVLSWRRSTGERRQQLKWLACGAAITLVAGILGAMLDCLRGQAMCSSGITALPISIGVGILKYRLYEIDRVISRTLAYAIVTGVVIGLYVGIITLVTRVLGFSSPVAVAASTLAAVALFNPLRVRVQRTVDRRFNRARYDAEATIASFTARLRDAVDLETVRSELLEVVNRAVEPRMPRCGSGNTSPTDAASSLVADPSAPTQATRGSRAPPDSGR